MKSNKNYFIEQYINYIINMQNAMLKNNYRTNNRYALKLNKLNDKYQNENYYIEALKELIDNNNIEVSFNASSDSLRHNCNIDKALKKIEEISNKQDIGIIRFEAEIALKIWKEKGIE